MVIDLVALAVLVLLVIRGWVRGMVREAIDVGTLIVGAVLAFRLAPMAGRFLAGLFGLTPDLALLIGGTVLFVGIAIGAAIVGSVINGSIKHLPGLSTLNRIGGAALGVVYAAILTIIAVTLMSAAPLPTAVADQVEDSRVVAYVIRPEGLGQRAIGVATGDRALQSMIWIRGVVDGWVIDPRITNVTLPEDSTAGGVHASTAAATSLFETINADRAGVGVDPLVWSDRMGLVAVTRATAVYRTGSFVAAIPVTERLDAVGVEYTVADEYLVLAPTIEGLADATDPGIGFVNAGIGVVEGPYGLIAVVVLTG
jgi:membrane protein required for colicin V production